MYPSVKKVVPCDDYLLSIEFDNGESGILDMKKIMDFGVFKKLKDPALFKQVRIVFDTIEWSSGIDLDPEYIYSNCKRSKVAQVH